MDAEKVALSLYQYYLSTRGVGHTVAMVDGAAKSGAIILANTQTTADLLSIQCGRSKRGLHSFGLESAIEFGKLRGLRLPILLDNSALILLLDELLSKIHGLKMYIAEGKEN